MTMACLKSKFQELFPKQDKMQLNPIFLILQILTAKNACFVGCGGAMLIFKDGTL